MTDAEFDRIYEEWKKKEEEYYSQPAGAVPHPGPPPQPPAGYNGKYKKLFEPGGPHSPLHKNPKGDQPDPLDLNQEQQDLLDEVRANFPWMSLIGLEKFVINLIRQGATIDEIYAKVRQTDQYKRQFPGMVAADGTRRFATEADYIDHVNQLREVLKKYGNWSPGRDNPMDYLAFIDAGIDPDELDQRLGVYTAIQRAGGPIKDAFYVYAGLDITDDHLYQAVVSPEFRQAMLRQYEESVARQKLDYEKWITRATERGLSRVVTTLQRMQKLGLLTGEAISQLLQIDPNFAREMMGALFQTAVKTTRTLALDELLEAFNVAMIGSAAREAGFELPDRARVLEFINAGIQRSQALRGYHEIALRRAGLSSIAQRFRQGVLSRAELEEAFILQEAPSVARVSRLYQQESSLAQAGGGFARSLEGGRVIQQMRRIRG